MMDPILPPLSTNETAERILNEAWELFQSKGYRGVSMDEVCHHSKITKPTLYYYFQNKETLYIQALMRELQGYRLVLESDQPLEARLHDLIVLLTTRFRVGVTAMLRDMEHITDVRYHALVNGAFRREFFDPLAALMHDGIARGELRAGQNIFYAWAFLGLVNTFLGQDHKPEINSELLADQIIQLFFYGVRQSPAPSEKVEV